MKRTMVPCPVCGALILANTREDVECPRCGYVLDEDDFKDHTYNDS